MPTVAPAAAPPGTPTLLLVEPSEPLRGFLHHHLAAEPYAVVATTDAADARRALARSAPDIAVVALDGAGGGGLDLISHIREGSPRGGWDPGIPIVAVGRDADPFSVARALARGADDHVARPVHIAELAARAAALMRRTRGRTLRDEVRVGTLLVDRRGRRATVNGVRVCLSAKEFALLDALARDPFRVLTKDELLRDVWGYVSAGRTRTVDSHASRLRRKLAAAGGGERFVANVWGVGYRLLPEAA